MKQWYVARTKTRQEAQASAILERRGLETFSPVIPARPRQPRRRPEPLFPGYLFAHMDTATCQWMEARSAPGIVYFLGGDHPAALPDDIVADIRQRLLRQEYGRRSQPFRMGERVRIVGGAMDGLEAIFDGNVSAAGRVRVLLSIINRLVPVTLEWEQLRQAG